MKILYYLKKNSSALSILILVVSFGLIIGHSLFTFVYAKGFSYFSPDPGACKNCHVMNQVYESWMKGGHQNNATCNDCHVPHDFVGKWMFKAESGFHHSYAFTFKDNPVSFSASKKSKEIIQNNCMTCHKDYAHHAINSINASPDSNFKNEPLNCISCHRDAGHAHNF